MNQDDFRYELEDLIREAKISHVAAQAGIHHSLLVKWLKGTRRLNVDDLEKVANAVGYELSLRRRRRSRSK